MKVNVEDSGGAAKHYAGHGSVGEFLYHNSLFSAIKIFSSTKKNQKLFSQIKLHNVNFQTNSIWTIIIAHKNFCKKIY